MDEIIKFKEWYKNNNLQAGQTYLECQSIYENVLKSNLIDGDIAEVGVHHGGSAKILNQFKLNNKKLYLFDSFEGVGNCIPEKDTYLIDGNLKPEITIDDLKNIFINDNVEIIKGFFPKSAPEDLNNKKFSLVHVDVDTYLSTLETLEFFYDKMSINGIFIIHDYEHKFGHTDGVKFAVDEFLKDKKEVINGIYDTQCIIVKI
jgi:hypothetical protein